MSLAPVLSQDARRHASVVFSARGYIPKPDSCGPICLRLAGSMSFPWLPGWTNPRSTVAGKTSNSIPAAESLIDKFRPEGP